MAIILAIQEAASAIVSGSGNFSKTAETVKKLRSLLDPESGEAETSAAEATKKLLEQEFNKGPMLVQRLDYAQDKRRRKRRQ
jgi:hypothetical protein